MPVPRSLGEEGSRRKYLLRYSHIDVPCSEINLQVVNENNINKEKRSSHGAPTLVFIPLLRSFWASKSKL